MKLTKTRLALTVVLLGVPSSVSLSAFDLSSISLGNLFNPSWGGAKNVSLEEGVYSLESKELDLDNKINPLTISKSQEVANVALQEVQSQPVDLSNEQTVNEKDQAPTIQSIYSENTKEKKALKVDKDSQAEVVKFAEKSSKWIKDYRSAKSKLDSFLRSSRRVTRRSKRNAPQNISPNLTKKEREAIWEMYKLFEEVEKERKKLVPQFNAIDNKVVIRDSTNSRPNQSEIIANLNKIQWTTNEKVKFDNPAPKPRVGRRSPAPTTPTWEIWTNNPFKLFMKEDDYKSLMTKIKQTKAEKSISGRRDFVRSGMRGHMIPSAQTRKQEENEEKAKEEVAQTVALKFLEWMGQTNSLSL